jgi:hypothetical protein
MERVGVYFTNEASPPERHSCAPWTRLGRELRSARMIGAFTNNL